MSDPAFTEHEQGERAALLQVRRFLIRHGPREVDAFCAQRLADIRMDAMHRERGAADQATAAPPTN